jgi:hypothetical protein
MDERRMKDLESERLGAAGIDDPTTAQPSLRNIPGDSSGGAGSAYEPHDEPAEGGVDTRTGPDASGGVGAGTNNIREGNVGGVMGGPRQSQGQGQGG